MSTGQVLAGGLSEGEVDFPLPSSPPPGLSAEAYGEGGRGDFRTLIY